jgi:UDP-glucose 4-epimerase
VFEVLEMRAAITGGAGFLGSHLTEALVKKEDVIVFDNFSSGRRDFLQHMNVEIIHGDIRNSKEMREACKEIDAVYHFAADPDVRRSFSGPLENFKIDVLGTLNVLEACRLNDVKQVVFASSSVVYGVAETPTPEEAPIAPISNYGAAKAACEHYISSYSKLYGIKATILRYANVIGPRLTHGVIYDFYSKLNANPRELEVFGDGNQRKSYLNARDAVSAALLTAQKTSKCEVFNVGTEETITVKKIGSLVVSTLRLRNVRYRFTGGRAGWPGDVPVMLLSTGKLRDLGWKPKFGIEETVIQTINWLKTHSGQI